jgi:hypothetical protein
MRGVRSTLALVAVLAGLGAYVYFVTWRKADTDTEAKKEKVFPSIQIGTIDEIRVKSASGEATTLKKQNGVWQITDPIMARADDGHVNAITGQLNMVEIARVVDENPSDLKDYGLATPRIEIDFKASNDKEYRKLAIGDKSTAGIDLFAKRNDDKRVFLIPAYQESAFNLATFDLRDKTLLRFDHDKVDHIELMADGKTIEIGKDGTDWKLKKPIQVKADASSVEGLLGRLQTAQMKSLVAADAKPADLKKYGLDKPAVIVNVTSGSSRATLLIGGKTSDKAFYARDASQPAVVTIDSPLIDALRKGADEYRRKDLFEFRPYNANRIEITRDGQTVVFDQTKGQVDAPLGKWKRVSPNPGDVDKDKFDDFLGKLSNMRAIAFVDAKAKTGLNQPVMTVSLKFNETKEERVSFGKVESDVYASLSGESGAAQASAADFTVMTKALDEVAK